MNAQLYRRESRVGVQSAPPVYWHSAAPSWSEESNTSVEGKLVPPTGEMTSNTTPTFTDISIQGGSGAGRVFDHTTGTWTDDITLPDYGSMRGLYFANSAAGGTFEALETTVFQPGTGIHMEEIILRRGLGNAALTTIEDNYTYIELANGDTSNYRIALLSGSQVRLDYFDPTASVWLIGVSYCKNTATVGALMSQNRDEIHFKIQPDNIRNIMLIEVGDNQWLKHSPQRDNLANTITNNPNVTNLLPQNERIRIYGKNAWCQVFICPLKSKSIVVNKSKKQFPPTIGDISGASISINGLGRDDPNNIPSFTATQDENGNLQFTATITPQDNTKPVTASDIFFYIPSEYTQPTIGTLPPAAFPPLIRLELHEQFDDITRMVNRSATMIMDNQNGNLSGSYGNFAVDIQAGNGVFSSEQVLSGILAGGFTHYGPVNAHLCSAKVYDDSYIMSKAVVAQEVAFDRWCFFGAIHGILDLGQVPPWKRLSIPYYNPGPADYTCPYPILPAGTGNHPVIHYLPDAHPMQMWLDMLQDGFPDPVTGANTPLIGGQDVQGNWLIQTYDPRTLPLKAAYYDITESTGIRQIQDIMVWETVEDMRTSLDFQGQDPYTGELLYIHYPLDENLITVGFRDTWMERQGRWCSPAYLERIVQSAAIMASIPTQNVRIRVPYDPTIRAADLVYVQERSKLGGGGYYIVMSIDSALGPVNPIFPDGEQECSMTMLLKAALSEVPF